MRSCRVVAVDVGSVRGRFHWAGLDLPGRTLVGEGGDTPEGAAQAVVAGLLAGAAVALGFEAPIMVPVPQPSPDGWAELGRARSGEGNRSWSAGAGSGALATGLVEMAWLLHRVGDLHGAVTVTSQPRRWYYRDADLLVWEAFVSGPGKPVPRGVSQHAADAAAAATTFAERWESGTVGAGDVACAPRGTFNLAAAATMYAGLIINREEIHQPLVVLRTQPAAR